VEFAPTRLRSLARPHRVKASLAHRQQAPNEDAGSCCSPKSRGLHRDRKNVLASLFVDGTYHRRGIGRKLVERFERDSHKAGVDWIRVATALYAVPFYQSMAYKRTTDIRPCHSFQGTDLKQQPMKKQFT